MLRGYGQIAYAVGGVVWKCCGAKSERKKAIEEAYERAKQKQIEVEHFFVGLLSATLPLFIEVRFGRCQVGQCLHPVYLKLCSFYQSFIVWAYNFGKHPTSSNECFLSLEFRKVRLGVRRVS